MHQLTDEELLARQDALQAEAARILPDLGPVLATGSYVSGLMCWRDLDVMSLVGPEFTPLDVLAILGRYVSLPGVTGFDYRDERGPRSPTGQQREERYHVPITMGDWRIDLTLWLHDLHENVTEWHEELRQRITPEERLAVLRIKDVWHRRPDYPDEVSGHDIYLAVLDDGVRTPDEFSAWWRAWQDAPPKS